MRRAHRGVWCSKSTLLIEAELFAATAFAPCTGWPRTVMRGGLRKLTSGHNSLPKAARRTEPSPRNPRFAAQPKGVAAQRRVWGSQEGAREPFGALAPFCPRRRAAAMPGRRRRPLCTLTLSVKSPPAAHRCIGGKVYRLLTVSQKGALRRSFLTSNAFRFIMKAKTKSRRYFYYGSF